MLNSHDGIDTAAYLLFLLLVLERRAVSKGVYKTSIKNAICMFLTRRCLTCQNVSDDSVLVKNIHKYTRIERTREVALGADCALEVE